MLNYKELPLGLTRFINIDTGKVLSVYYYLNHDVHIITDDMIYTHREVGNMYYAIRDWLYIRTVESYDTAHVFIGSWTLFTK